MMEEWYEFRPDASDADGDELTFSVENAPAWTIFDFGTGEISGRPTLADVGVYEGIQISVSDGKDSTAMASFSITVSQSELGTVTLQWTPPLTTEDGSALTDLAGYRIYYGKEEGDYPYVIEIDTPGLSTYVVENLLPRTYYFVATSIRANGAESKFTEVAVKTVL